MIIAFACSSRESQRPPSVVESKHDAAHDAAGAHRRIDEDRLVLPEWKPPTDVVRFTYAGEELYIDKTEVTVKAYRECVEAGVCSKPGPDAILQPYKDWANSPSPRTPPKENRCPVDEFNWEHADRDDHPVNCVTFWQAWRYCKFRGRRLPVEYEWKAAAGWTSPGSTSPDWIPTYPWGRGRMSCDRAVMAGSKRGKYQRGCAPGHTMAVGSKPLGATSTGILDMSGNVEEIVMDGPRSTEDDMSVRTFGGNYADTLETASTTLNVDDINSSNPGSRVGFRCLLWSPSNGRDVVSPIRSLPLPADGSASGLHR